MTLSFPLERSAVEKAVHKLKFRTQAFVDGRFCDAASGKTYTSIDPATRIGPMIEESHMNKVLGYIESGKEEGADLVLGGKRVLQKTGGYFVAATIFDNVRRDMRIAREEVFGPVLSVFTCDTEAEAIALANDTTYGLTASVYTQNVGTAHRVARALRAGTVSVNCFSEGDVTTPFGGFEQSGFFGRDKSIFAHYQYTELKTVWIQLT